jgi:hypothetical protein
MHRFRAKICEGFLKFSCGATHTQCVGAGLKPGATKMSPFQGWRVLFKRIASERCLETNLSGILSVYSSVNSALKISGNAQTRLSKFTKLSSFYYTKNTFVFACFFYIIVKNTLFFSKPFELALLLKDYDYKNDIPLFYDGCCQP